MLRAWIRLLRPAHWIKNILVFAPLFFSGGVLFSQRLISVAIAFLSFCFAASAVYVFNDLADAENDRKHPTKRDRPIASGAISERMAAVTFGILSVLASSFAFICAGIVGIVCVAGYVLINVAYSKGLKKIPLVDVVLLSAGYVIRMVFGAIAADVVISEWLYLTVMAGSFCLGLGKRRGESDVVGAESRSVLSGYTREFLDKNMYVCMALTMTFYSLWARERPIRLASVPLVLIIFMRYSLDIERDGDGDPMGVVLGDRMLVALIALYILSAVLVVYLPW